MLKSIYYILGYDDYVLEEADEKQKHLKHLICKQIKLSNIKLRKNNILTNINYETIVIKKKK
jgi:hypothetical protein